MRPFDRGDFDRFVDSHLTAAAVMVELAEPFAPRMRALEAKRVLREKDFDLAVVDDDSLAIVTRRRLDRLSRPDLGRPVVDFAQSPIRDRLIERTLPIRRVVGLLLARSDPLLVVGERGLTHVITLADFAGVAGSAVVLSFMLAVDRVTNEILRPCAAEAFRTATQKEREDAEKRRSEAAAEGAALELIDYLGMGARLRAIRNLRLATKYQLGSKEEHQQLVRIRNAAAHSGLGDPQAALTAIATAEWVLENAYSAIASMAPPVSPAG